MVIPPGALDLVPMIPIAAIVMYGLVKVSRSPIGQALARRIEGQALGDTEDQVVELEEQLHSLETRVLETQERLDFTERLLARAGDRGARLRPAEWSDTPDAGIATPV